MPSTTLFTLAEIAQVAQDQAPEKFIDTTAWFGLLGPVAMALGILGLGWALKQSSSVKAWKETSEAAEHRAEIYEKEKLRLETVIKEREIARQLAEEQLDHQRDLLKIEQQKRDFTPVMEIFLNHQSAISERHARMLELLHEILAAVKPPEDKKHPRGPS